MFRDDVDDDGDDYVRVLTKLDSCSFPPPPDLSLLLHLARQQAHDRRRASAEEQVSWQLGLYGHGGREPGVAEWTTRGWW
jgi:hypothetical protein